VQQSINFFIFHKTIYSNINSGINMHCVRFRSAIWL